MVLHLKNTHRTCLSRAKARDCPCVTGNDGAQARRDKNHWSQDLRSSYLPVNQNCLVHENATKNTRKDVLGPVERTYHVCEWRTGTQGTDFPSILVGGPEKRKRLDVVAASKRSSEVVARLNRKCPRRQLR